MGYYTGQIFEVSHPDLPYSLAGGGRYDGMMARFGAPALPCAGFPSVLSVSANLSTGTFSPPAGQSSRDMLGRRRTTALPGGGPRRAEKTSPWLVVNVVRRARNARKQRDDLEGSVTRRSSTEPFIREPAPVRTGL